MKTEKFHARKDVERNNQNFLKGLYSSGSHMKRSENYKQQNKTNKIKPTTEQGKTKTPSNVRDVELRGALTHNNKLQTQNMKYEI